MAEFIDDLRQRKVRPHIVVNGALSKRGKVRKTSIDGRTTRHPGYGQSQRDRRRTEEPFGWIEAPAGFAKVKLRGLAKVDAPMTMAAAYDLPCLANLALTPP